MATSPAAVVVDLPAPVTLRGPREEHVLPVGPLTAGEAGAVVLLTAAVAYRGGADAPDLVLRFRPARTGPGGDVSPRKRWAALQLFGPPHTVIVLDVDELPSGAERSYELTAGAPGPGGLTTIDSARIVVGVLRPGQAAPEAEGPPPSSAGTTRQP